MSPVPASAQDPWHLAPTQWMFFKIINASYKILSDPGQESQLVRASFRYAKVVGLIPGQGTYKKQPVIA